MGGRPDTQPPQTTPRPVVIATTPSDRKLPPAKMPVATPSSTVQHRATIGGLIIVDSRALLKTFASYVGITEQPMGSNNGPMVNKFNASCGLKPSDHAPWCAAVAHYGYMVNGAGDRPGAYSPSWYAKSRVITAKEVQPGDVGLIYFPSKGRYAHTITAIEKVNWSGRVVSSYVTLEGNTNAMGSRDGDRFARRVRPADTVTVVRWTN